MAHAQTAAVTYSSWPIGFGSNLTVGQSPELYGNFAGFDGSARGFSYMRANFPNGWFVGSEGGGAGLGFSGINQASAFNALNYQGMQFGYNFQNAHGLPVTVYAGFDTLKYNPGLGSPFASFDAATLPGYRAHAGVEFQPAPNVSLSLDFGYTQLPGRTDGDFNSLPGASPFGLGRR